MKALALIVAAAFSLGAHAAKPDMGSASDVWRLFSAKMAQGEYSEASKLADETVTVEYLVSGTRETASRKAMPRVLFTWKASPCIGDSGVDGGGLSAGAFDGKVNDLTGRERFRVHDFEFVKSKGSWVLTKVCLAE